jgi:DUF917 family protein
MFTLTIELGNDAMRSKRDVAKALEVVADRLRSQVAEGKIRDVNGNTVGSFAYSKGEQ